MELVMVQAPRLRYKHDGTGGLGDGNLVGRGFPAAKQRRTWPGPLVGVCTLNRRKGVGGWVRPIKVRTALEQVP